MTKCVCGNPEFEDQNINKDSDSGQKNESIIQPSEPETASNHKPNKLTNSNENNDFSADIEDFYDVVQHANTSVLCDILKKQNFDKSEGPFLEDRLKPDRGPNKFGKIHKNLNLLITCPGAEVNLFTLNKKAAKSDRELKLNFVLFWC